MIDRIRRTSSALAVAAALVLVPALAATLVPGCAAPTLPLPPPTALVTAPDQDGFVTVSGMVRPNATVFVINENALDPTERGVIVDADDVGAYSATIRAMAGDTITVFAREGTSDSQPTMRVVPTF